MVSETFRGGGRGKHAVSRITGLGIEFLHRSVFYNPRPCY